jgi:CheY-like chemotaxis protein
MFAPVESVAPIDVLITDDDPDSREAVRLLLEGDGYRCAEAENGYEAVEIARRCPPRLVLLDLMMPNLDGFAAARKLRADPRTHTVPIYCLSAWVDPAARTKAQRAGCEVFLAKPIDATELLDVVSLAMQP